MIGPYTKADVLRIVRALHMRVSYDSAYDEWKIDYYESDPRWTPDSAYYTTYRDDAVGTAKVMAAFKTAGKDKE